MSPFAKLRRRPSLAAFALLAFSLRALIPAGFMPSGEGLFALQFCPDGLSPEAFAKLDPHAAHRHHPAGHDHKVGSSHCPFAAIASAPPSSQAPALPLTPEVVAFAQARVALSFPESHRFRIAQPRGPPSVA